MTSKERKINQQRYVREVYRVCFYCGEPGDTIDHKIPVCRGGSSKQENLVLACVECNSRKSDMTDSEYWFFMETGRYDKTYIWYKQGKDPDDAKGKHKIFYADCASEDEG